MSSLSVDYNMDTVAPNYSKYRPGYTVEIYDKILEYLDRGASESGRGGLAVDIGCGCGESTIPLAKHFQKVIGIDPSEVQLKEALKVSAEYPNVEYKLGFAEDMSAILKDETVDLVTVGEALHWFDSERFDKECVRILKPGGAFAAYFYLFLEFENEEASKIVQEIFRGTQGLANYWNPTANIIFEDCEEPYAVLHKYLSECVRYEPTKMKYSYSLSDFIGFIKSFPEYYAFKVDHPEEDDSIQQMLQKLQDILGVKTVDEKFGDVIFTVRLIMGRKPSDQPPAPQQI